MRNASMGMQWEPTIDCICSGTQASSATVSSHAGMNGWVLPAPASGVPRPPPPPEGVHPAQSPTADASQCSVFCKPPFTWPALVTVACHCAQG
jgi:hypothetical protein